LSPPAGGCVSTASKLESGLSAGSAGQGHSAPVRSAGEECRLGAPMTQPTSAIQLRGPPQCRLRQMTLGDVPIVAALERECFRNPWSERAFSAEVIRDESIPLVAVEGSRIVAYAIAWVVADELHVVNVAVEASRRRQGLAVALINALIAEARVRGARLATLEVRSRNEAAIGLYQSFGFKPVAIRRRYYRNPADDALVMLQSLEGDPGHGGAP
jgi:ribosomal-protein-alanine N-acetyltransferase